MSEDVMLECPTCGEKDAFFGNNDTVMDSHFCPKCRRLHVVQFEDGRWWAERTYDPDMVPDII